MTRQQSRDRIELVYGSLDMLILRTLLWGPIHGHGIAKSIERVSDEALKVEHGSLYPALQRLQQEGWISAKWGVSKNKQPSQVLPPDRRGTTAIDGRNLALGALRARHHRRSTASRVRGRAMRNCRWRLSIDDYRELGHGKLGRQGALSVVSRRVAGFS